MSDYLSDEEQMARLQGWWRSNGTWLAIAVVLAIALVLGWRWYQSQSATEIAAASDQYAAYLAAEPEAQAALGAALVEDQPDTAYAGFVHLRDAKAAADSGNYAEAGTVLDALLASKPDAVIAELARLRLARVRWQLGDAAAGLEVLGQIRSAGFRSQVAELKGDILLQQGDRSGAHEAYTAALAEVGATDERPVLEMKQINTATPDDARGVDDARGADDAAANAAGDKTEIDGEDIPDGTTQAEPLGADDAPTDAPTDDATADVPNAG